MATIRPFRALRPAPEAAAAVASVPYDVVDAAEARELAAGNPLSFLRVSRAEIDLPAGTDPYAAAVYRRAAANLGTLARKAPLVDEEAPSLYLYRLRAGNHEQTGVAGCFSLAEYDRHVVKRHEGTRPDKENDRTSHMLALGAQTGIVFLAYRADETVGAAMRRGAEGPPLLEVSAPDGVQHAVWRLGPADTAAMVAAFADVPALYIADGHHRVASAARARGQLGPAVAADPEAAAHFFLAAAFPDTETRILPYNRTVTHLGERSAEAFVEAVRARFSVRSVAAPAASVPPKGQVDMYLAGRWHRVDLGPGREVTDARVEAAGLDVARLHDRLLDPLLGITDVRNDPRIAFVGGAGGTAALEAAVDGGAAAVAFSLAPVAPSELLAVSDAGEMMPPKSTWFDPKLRDGLLIHRIAGTGHDPRSPHGGGDQ